MTVYEGHLFDIWDYFQTEELHCHPLSVVELPKEWANNHGNRIVKVKREA
jgi:hypothetical protein